MKIIRLNLRGSLNSAIRDIQNYIREKRKADNERSDLEKYALRNGISAENLRFREKMADIERAEVAACNNALRSFNKRIDDCIASVKKASYPAGEQIINDKTKADIWLLENDYITKPEELESMRERYISPINPAMLKIIACYASKHDSLSSDTFAFETDAASYILACDQLLKLAKSTVADVYCEASEMLMGCIDPKTNAAICTPLFDSLSSINL